MRELNLANRKKNEFIHRDLWEFIVYGDNLYNGNPRKNRLYFS